VSQYLKIGELAQITGVTVRTLHYYDEIDLLKPAKITEQGHRLYDIKNLTTLYLIISLKEMGLKLNEIRKLIYDRSIDVQKFVEIQITKVQEEIAQKQLFLRRLLKLKHELEERDNIAIDDVKELVPFIHSSADQYLTKEQFEKIKKNLAKDQAKSKREANWFRFIAKLEYCYKNNLPKTDVNARECINFWQEFMNKTIGNDEKLKDSIFSFHASLGNTQFRYGLRNELYQYLMELMNSS